MCEWWGPMGHCWQVLATPVASGVRRVDGVSPPHESVLSTFPASQWGRPSFVRAGLCVDTAPLSVILLCLHPLLSPCASQPLPQDFAKRCLVRVYGRSKGTNQTQLPIPGQFVQAGSEIGFSATPLISVGLP